MSFQHPIGLKKFLAISSDMSEMYPRKYHPGGIARLLYAVYGDPAGLNFIYTSGQDNSANQTVRAKIPEKRAIELYKSELMDQDPILIDWAIDRAFAYLRTVGKRRTNCNVSRRIDTVLRYFGLKNGARETYTDIARDHVVHRNIVRRNSRDALWVLRDSGELNDLCWWM
jgi:hypothetical protein